MIINAVIESKDGGTLVLDFPRSIYDVYEKLQSVGIRQSPHQITLSDEEGDDVRVKLYSEDETGKHLLLTLKEQNSLADANMLAFMVDNAKPDFRSKLEQNLLNDQYSSMQEVTDDIKQMLYESGPVKDVLIRNNTFIDCAYQGGPGNAIIALNPSNSIIDPLQPVHQNIKIINNRFLTFDYPVLFAKSTHNILFSGNTIERTYTTTTLCGNKNTFYFNGCNHITIKENQWNGWTEKPQTTIENMTKKSIKQKGTLLVQHK